MSTVTPYPFSVVSANRGLRNTSPAITTVRMQFMNGFVVPVKSKAPRTILSRRFNPSLLMICGMALLMLGFVSNKGAISGRTGYESASYTPASTDYDQVRFTLLLFLFLLLLLLLLLLLYVY